MYSNCAPENKNNYLAKIYKKEDQSLFPYSMYFQFCFFKVCPDFCDLESVLYRGRVRDWAVVSYFLIILSYCSFKSLRTAMNKMLHLTTYHFSVKFSLLSGFD